MAAAGIDANPPAPMFEAWIGALPAGGVRRRLPYADPLHPPRDAAHMCGRFTLSSPVDALAEEFGIVQWPADIKPRYNIAPTQPVLAIRADEDRTRRPAWLRWGLIPGWAEDPSIGNRLINARAETVASKPAFRNAFRHRRCLVLADGFFEWARTGTTKTPMYVHLASRRPFAFAGLWERWRSRDDQAIESCTLITTDAAPAIARIHPRMPVVLDREDRDRWIEPETPPAELQSMLHPYRGDDLEAYPVSRVVNSPANDSPECIAPV